MSGWGIAETAPVIEKIKAESADYLRGLNSCGDITWSVYDKAFDFYMELISRAYEQGKKDAQPEQQWIPCSERLPEDYQDVLVWFEYYRYGSYNRMYSTHGIGTYSKQYDSWMVNHESGWEDLRVIAWMPLPEPWKGEER